LALDVKLMRRTHLCSSGSTSCFFPLSLLLSCPLDDGIPEVLVHVDVGGRLVALLSAVVDFCVAELEASCLNLYSLLRLLSLLDHAVDLLAGVGLGDRLLVGEERLGTEENQTLNIGLLLLGHVLNLCVKRRG
jgi:hypothetical protein